MSSKISLGLGRGHVVYRTAVVLCVDMICFHSRDGGSIQSKSRNDWTTLKGWQYTTANHFTRLWCGLPSMVKELNILETLACRMRRYYECHCHRSQCSLRMVLILVCRREYPYSILESCHVGAKIIRIGFWGVPYCIYSIMGPKTLF